MREASPLLFASPRILCCTLNLSSAICAEGQPALADLALDVQALIMNLTCKDIALSVKPFT
jgi:hypothetical protein